MRPDNPRVFHMSICPGHGFRVGSLRLEALWVYWRLGRADPRVYTKLPVRWSHRSGNQRPFFCCCHITYPESLTKDARELDFFQLISACVFRFFKFFLCPSLSEDVGARTIVVWCSHFLAMSARQTSPSSFATRTGELNLWQVQPCRLGQCFT